MLAARSTLEPQKTAGQHTTRQIGPHLAFDEVRNLAAAFSLVSEKGFEMARNRPLQQRVFRIPWPILIFVGRSG